VAVQTKTTSVAPAPRSKWKKGLKIAGVCTFTTLALGVGAGYVVWMKALDSANTKLPQLEGFIEHITEQPSRIMSADGKILYEISEEKREPIRIDDVPKIVKDATLAAEDKRFYQHQGVDAWAVARQVFTNVKEKRVAGGASTLTMQLAKRLFTNSQQTLQRKLQDAAVAVQIERHYTKDQILELYLNQVFYGQNSYGIAKAADTYFGKKLKDLTVAEAATLARCVRRPSDENPVQSPEKAIANRNDVLRIMLDEHFITQQQYDKAKAEKLHLVSGKKVHRSGEKIAPYFVDFVLAEIADKCPNVDLSQGGYTIETTLDTRLEEKAEEAVRKVVRDYRGSRVKTGAFIMLDKQGRILSMVGGVDYERNQYNMVVNGKRQVGSSFKPFVYSVALERGVIQPDSMISNEPIKWYDPQQGKDWTPHNSSGNEGGMVSLRTAFSMSINLAAIHVLMDTGPQEFVGTAQGMFGFHTKLPANYSLALGAVELSPMELASAYTVFLTKGTITPPYGISVIKGPDGSVLKDMHPERRQSGLSSGTLDTMDSLMRAVVTSGTGTLADSIPNARAKTGTTNDNRDAWFVGYTDELLGVAWISNEQKDDKTNQWIYPVMSPDVFGGKVAVRIWTRALAPAQRAIGETETRHDWADLVAREEGSRRRRHDRGSILDAGDDTTTPVTPADGAPATPDDTGGLEPAIPPSDTPETTKPRPPRSRRPRNETPPPDEPIAPPKGDGIPGVPDSSPQPRERKSHKSTVTVWICAESGLLAKSSCNEQIPRTYTRGQEPKRYCNKH